MTERRLFLEAGLMSLATALLPRAAAAAPVSKVVTQKDMPPVNLEGWRVTAVEVSLAPGDSSARHRHPGFVIGYVLEGQYRFAVAGQPDQVLSAGQMFFESPGDVHATSANASQTEPAKILAMVFTPKDQPVTLPGER